MTEQFANEAQGVLATSITASQTTISITPTDYTGRASSSNFPLQGNFRIVVQSFDVTTQIPTSSPEIMIVTAVAGNVFTVQRGAENTQAIAFASGAQVVHVVTAGVMQAIASGETNVAYTNVANTFIVAPQTINIDADGHVGFVINGHSATQSANLFETYFNGVLGAHINAHAEFTNPGVISTNERYGNNAARNITTGTTGLYFGTNSGTTITTGNTNTFTGYNTDGLASNTSQATIYGSGSKAATNTITIGVQNKNAAQNSVVIAPLLINGAGGVDAGSTNLIYISATGQFSFAANAANSVILDTSSSGLGDIEAAQNIAIGDSMISYGVRNILQGWTHNNTSAYTDLALFGTSATPNRNGEMRHTGGVVAASERFSMASLTSTSAEAKLFSLDGYFIVSTNASYTTGIKLNAWDFNNVAREGLRIESSGSVPQIGFFGTTSVAQQSGNAVTALANYGLVTSATWPAASLTGTLAAAQFPALTSDVTTSAGSLVTTIANAAVTYAKFQAVAALSVTGVSGNVGGPMGAITANTADTVFRMNSAANAIGFGAVNLASANAVTGLLQAANGGLGVIGPTRTTAAVTNATATMSAITGLSAQLLANSKYVGLLVLFANNSTALEGLQFDFNGGTATIAGGGYIEYGFAGTPIGATLGVTTSTALATAITATTATTGDDIYLIPFTVGTKNAGTLIPEFAEVTHTTGTATIQKGSYMFIMQTNN